MIMLAMSVIGVCNQAMLAHLVWRQLPFACMCSTHVPCHQGAQAVPVDTACGACVIV